jgi:histone H3/H4
MISPIALFCEYSANDIFIAKALREIRHWQKTTFCLIPRGAFRNLVREIGADMSTGGHADPIRWQAQAVLDLQEMAERFLVEDFSASNFCAIHARRITLKDTDMKLVERLHGSHANQAQRGHGKHNQPDSRRAK